MYFMAVSMVIIKWVSKNIQWLFCYELLVNIVLISLIFKVEGIIFSSKWVIYLNNYIYDYLFRLIVCLQYSIATIE